MFKRVFSDPARAASLLRAAVPSDLSGAINWWLEVTRPMLEAYFHARFFLEMVIQYGEELDQAPAILPSGWAAVLYLYDLR